MEGLFSVVFVAYEIQNEVDLGHNDTAEGQRGENKGP